MPPRSSDPCVQAIGGSGANAERRIAGALLLVATPGVVEEDEGEFTPGDGSIVGGTVFALRSPVLLSDSIGEATADVKDTQESCASDLQDERSSRDESAASTLAAARPRTVGSEVITAGKVRSAVRR